MPQVDQVEFGDVNTSEKSNAGNLASSAANDKPACENVDPSETADSELNHAALPHQPAEYESQTKVRRPNREPALPARPYSVPERDTHWFQVVLNWIRVELPGSRHTTKILIVTALCACLFAWYLMHSSKMARQQHQIQQLWITADSYFRQAQFQVAKSEYEKFSKQYAEWNHAQDRTTALAQSMIEICDACDGVELFLDTSETTSQSDLASLLDRLKQASDLLIGDDLLSESLVQQTRSPIQQDAPEDPAVGLEFTPAQRWQETLQWLHSRSNRISNSLQQAPRPTADGLAQLDHLIRFLEEFGQEVSALKSTSQAEHVDNDFFNRLEAFRQASIGVIKNFDKASIQRTRELWKDLEQRFSDRVDPALWTEHTEELRQELVKRIQPERTPTGQVPLGKIDPIGPLKLPTQDYSALTSGNLTAKSEPSGELVFVRVEDRCYALDGATGETAWVCRLGYDIPWLPRQIEHAGQELLLLVWDRQESRSITLARSRDLEPIWSLHLPETASLANRPIFVGDNLYLLFNSGELWQLNLSDGQIQTRLEFPEPMAGPMVVQPDHSFAVCVGRELAIYLLDLRGEPHVRTVALRAEASTLLDYYGVWVQPFLLLFQNDLTGKCGVHVFLGTDERFEEVQQLEIPGKLWQIPAVRGASIFVMTDRGFEALLALRVDQPDEPLYTVFQHQRTGDTLLRPYFLSHPQAPCVAALGSSVVSYWIDPLKPRSNRSRNIVWNRDQSHPDNVVNQDLQRTETGVVLVTQRPAKTGVIAECVDLEEGKLQWTRTLGCSGAESLTEENSSHLASETIIRTERDTLHMLSLEKGNWRTHPLPIKSVNETVAWAPKRSWLVWAAADPPQLKISSLEGTTISKHALSARAASPVAVHEGPITCFNQAGDQSIVEGVWAVFVDIGRKVQLISLKREGPTTQFVELPEDAPKKGWLRPVWIDSRSLLLVHPDGYVARTTFLAENNVVSLFLAASRMLPGSGIIGKPLIDRGHIWVSSRDSGCQIIDLDSLNFVAKVGFSAPPSTQPALGKGISIGLANGKVGVLSTKTSGELLTEVQLSSTPITFIAAHPRKQHLYATDQNNQFFEIDERGELIHETQLFASPSIPPVILASEVFVVTVEGSLTKTVNSLER